MTDTVIFERLTALLREVFYNDSIVATPDLTAQKVDGWNSLGHVRLLAEIERDFAIRFNSNEVSSLRTVGQLAELIQRKVLLQTVVAQ
jgi:acyl carrier protein